MNLSLGSIIGSLSKSASVRLLGFSSRIAFSFLKSNSLLLLSYSSLFLLISRIDFSVLMKDIAIS